MNSRGRKKNRGRKKQSFHISLMCRVAFTQFLGGPAQIEFGSPLKSEPNGTNISKIAVGAYLNSFTGDFVEKGPAKENAYALLHGVTLGMDRTLTLRQFSMANWAIFCLAVVSKVLGLALGWKMGHGGHVMGILMMNCSADGAYTLHLTLTYFALA